MSIFPWRPLGIYTGIGAGQQFMPQASAVIRAATRRTGAAVVQPRVIVRTYGRNAAVSSLPRVTTTAVGLAGLVAACTSAPIARCDNSMFLQPNRRETNGAGGNSSKANDDDDMIEKFIDKYGPEMSQVSFGGVLGFCSGYAVKEVGKVAAVTFGGLFILAQLAASQGYIDIKWNKVKDDIHKAVDTDGDGKITKEDVKRWCKKALAVLKYNLPSSGGFACGFFLGLSV